jgi:predicted anti-sigma-YlaC factor YlaD
MTCGQVGALLSEYLDNDLTAEQAAQIKAHLSECAECRTESDDLLAVKNALGSSSVGLPKQEYWDQTEELILEKTTRAVQKITPVRSSADRQSFTRALVSLAASLVILVSALMVGGDLHSQLARQESEQSPALVTISVQESVGGHHKTFHAMDEEYQLTRSLILIAPPGMLGRFVMPPEISSGSSR